MYNYDNYFDEMYNRTMFSKHIPNRFGNEYNTEKERTVLDRLFDTLNVGQYASAGFVRGFVDDELNPIQGLVQGIAAANPFGKGKNEWEYSYSGVLEEAGWKPESFGGKALRGIVGFAGDVLLDPMTYVSGGLSGLVKGTGKHSVNAALGSAELIDKLGDSAKFVDGISDATKGVGMTQELAEQVVKNSRVFQSGQFDLDITEEAKKLMDKYNSLLGVNTKSADVTLSLANAPFGKKIFGKNADKSITLIDSDLMKEIGDKTFAPMYGKIRNTVIGGQIGKLFSTNHVLYKLGKSNPEEVYNFIKEVELKTGLGKGKLSQEAIIRANAEILGNLTPSEQKEIVDALQDKTIWHPIKQTIDFIDTKEASRYKEQILKTKFDAQKKLDNIVNFVEKTKDDFSKINIDIEKNKEAMNILNKKKIEDIMSINDKYASELGKSDSLMKEIIKSEQYINNNLINPNDLVKRFKGISDDVAQRNLDIELNKKLYETFYTEGVVDKDGVISFLSELSKPDSMKDSTFKRIKSILKKDGFIEYKLEKYADDVLNYFPDWQKVKNEKGYFRVIPAKNIDGVSKVSALDNVIYENMKPIDKQSFIDDLSTYIFGNKGFLSYNIYDSNVKTLVDMIENGKGIDELSKYVFENKTSYNGSAIEMWRFIAQQVGYDKWEDYYTKPMNELLDKKLKVTEGTLELTNKELIDLDANITKLQKKKLQRDLLIKQFDGKSSLDDVTDFINEFKDNLYERQLDDIMEGLYNRGLSGKDLDELKRNEWNIEAYMDNYEGGLQRQFQRKYISDNYQLGKNTKQELLSYYIEDIMKKDVTHNLSKSEKKYYDDLSSVVNEILQEKKVDIGFLDEAERYSIYERANKRLNARKIDKSLSPEVSKIQKDIVDIKSKTKIQDAIFNSVKRNNIIQFKSEGKVVEGIVDNVIDNGSEKIFKVTVDGVQKYIYRSEFVSRLGKVAPRNLDDIVDMSQLHSDFITKQQDVYDKLSKTIDTFPKGHEEEITKTIKYYDDAINKLNSEALELTNSLKKTKVNLNIDYTNTIDKLKGQIEEYDKLLNDASAFETYVRYSTDFGSKNVDEVIKKYNPNIGEYVLRDDLPMSEKYREIVTMLRDEFIRMGESEVGIGKLKQEQLDALMYEYLPHILTPEGEELFSNKEIQKVFENFGDDFGLGREFNPFAKSRSIKVLPDGNGGWIENPTIEEINNYFKEFTKGKNVFSENLADIYLARAMKNSDLMYDNKYMNNMLEVFGSEYTGEVKEGFSTVMNYGKLKEYSSDVVKFNTSLDIGDNISSYIIENDIVKMYESKAIELIRTNPEYANKSLKRVTSDLISQEIEKYMSEVLTEEVRHNMYLSNLENFFRNTNTSGMLDDIAVPMAQLDDVQISSLNNEFVNLQNRFQENIRKKISRYILNNTKTYGSWDEEIIDIKNIVSQLLENADDVDTENINRIVKRIEQLENLPSPQIKQVNDAIVQKANQARKLQIIKDNNDMLQIYDKITHFMKLNQTAILPSFHARNKMSNMFNNWLEIGSDALNLDFQKQTLNVMKGNNVDELFEIIGKDGSTTSIKWKDLYQAAQDYGAVDSGVFAKEIGVGTSSKGLLHGKIPGKFDPTNTKDFIGYTWGTKIGTVVENHDRFIHFASQVKNGMSFSEAAESVNKFLFDYSDLTMFEQSVMKRMFPYYTWLRKNGQLQLEMMLNKPEKYRNISKIIGGIEGMVDEDERINKNFVNDFAKDWVQLPFYVTNPEGRLEPVLWNPNLPFMDINRIPDITRPGDSLRDLFTQTNPLIKVPLEQLLNRNVFFDKPIVSQGESQLGRRADHVASQFGAYPVLKGMVEKQGLDFGLHMLNSTSGVKLISYDYDKYKAMKISEMVKKKERSKSNPGILDTIKRRLGGY